MHGEAENVLPSAERSASAQRWRHRAVVECVRFQDVALWLVLVTWSALKLVPGVLVCWLAGVLVRWSAAALECCCSAVGLDCWCPKDVLVQSGALV